ncbi:maltose-binding periplasmic protein precursor [bacterium BMS3Abin05]|nr:maltose-binding periplasmic protein precursor [bacterium BMS3Abin05]GBE26814.1 maltose-binding periplasmic protein precursor [bacterium BMS3Bbin03]
MGKTTLIMLSLFAVFTVLMFTRGMGHRNAKDIVIWTQDFTPGRVVLDSVLQDYQASHPNIKVSELYYETEELRSNFIVAALGGSGPDIVYGPSDQVGPFDVMRIILPMEDYFSPEERSHYIKDALVWRRNHLFQVADRIGNELTLVYNKKLVPVPPRNTDELIKMGKKLTKDLNGDGRIDQYALAWNYIEPYFFVPFLGGFGGWVMDAHNNPTLDTPATVEACQFILDLRNKYKIIPLESDYDMADALFKQGHAAMIINGPWSWDGYKKAGIDFDITRIPRISQTGLWPTPMYSPKGYSININVKGEKLKQVVALIKYLTSTRVELRFSATLSTIPTQIAARENPAIKNNHLIQQSMYQLEVSRPMSIEPVMRAIWDAMRPGYQSLFAGTLTPKQAAKQMQQDAVQKIREMKE